MKVLVACEYSQIVTQAFRTKGHEAFSCDLLPTEGNPDFHFQIDAAEALKMDKWDLVIAHPPCTRICNSGVLRLYYGGKKENGINPEKWADMLLAVEFFKSFLNAADKVCIENPVPHGYALERIGIKYSQTIQPYEFGEDASKRTCLWLKGLPKLKGTDYYTPRIVAGKPRWGNQTDSGQNKLTPGEDRWKDRSRTYKGIAEAMAEQWGSLETNKSIVNLKQEVLL